MNRTLLALANGGVDLALAAPAAPLVDKAARTISGLAVPFGPAGQTSRGTLQFSAGSLTWSSASRVKMLREHDQRDPVGLGRELVELDAAEVDRRMTTAGREPIGLPGLWATFHVPEGASGDQALREAESGLRDAFSVGVQLDDKTQRQLTRAQGGAVQGSGRLREVSLVSIPAFDDARVGSVAANAPLVIASWTNPQENPVRCSSCFTIHAAGVTACPPDALAAAGAALAHAASSVPAPTPPTQTPAPTDPAAPTQPVPGTPANPTPPPASSPPMATAGAAAYTTGEPSTYSFSGDGPSLVMDAWDARTNGDSTAAERLHRYNAELVGGNPASVMALAAVLKTTDVDGAGGDGQPVPLALVPVRRSDIIRQSIDRGRPLTTLLPKVAISNATPFLLPTGEPEFDGVGDHTEGTAHRAEGAMTWPTEVLYSPKAISGAFRLSREVVDATNPAIDQVALRAMLKDYRRKTEAKTAAAIAAADSTVTVSINTVAELRARLLAFGDDDITAQVILVGRTALGVFAAEVDPDGRPMLPYVGPSNASGTLRPGYTGFSLDGNDIVRSSAYPTAEGVIMDPDGFLVAESATQTFRFDEVEGPGIIKLALFGYFHVAALLPGHVDRFTTAAS